MKCNADKEEILVELSKTTTRLENKGLDMTGVYFGINEKVRRSQPIRQKKPGTLKPSETHHDNDIESLWVPEDDFIKIYPEGLNRISFRLSGSETLILFKIIPFIDYQSGMLKKDKRPLITKDVVALTGFSKVTVSAILERLIKERIMSRTRVGRSFEFFVNPYIFFKGKYINKTLLDMFKDYTKSR